MSDAQLIFVVVMMVVATLFFAVASTAMASEDVSFCSIEGVSKLLIGLSKTKPSALKAVLVGLTSEALSGVALLAIDVMVLNAIEATLISARVGAINCFENASGIRGDVILTGTCGGLCSCDQDTRKK